VVNEQEALNRMRIVIENASEYSLQTFVKVNSIEFLDYVEENRIYPSPEKIKAELNHPEPKRLKEVQSFLGLSGYFKKCI